MAVSVAAAVRTWSLIFALALLTGCRKAVVEPRTNPGVVAPGTKIHGKSYGGWSAEWWKFVFSIPVSDNPLLHDDKCDVAQSGPVWFLTGKFGESPMVATRYCTVPSGQYLFFPVVNTAADNTGNVPPKTIDELRASARETIDSYTARCWLDGKELQGVGTAPDSPYRVVSPVFRYRAPAGNFWGTAAGTLFDPVVSDGVWVMLEPPAVGRHTVRFTASSSVYSSAFDMTYQIDTVSPKR